MEKKIVNVLWTGGLDSTFLIIQLSQYENIIIQPIYIADRPRKSTPIELQRIDEILHIINKKKTNSNSTYPFLAEIKDPIIIEENQIKENNEITSSSKSLLKKYKLGSQYELIARLAIQIGLQLEVGILTDFKNSKVGKALKCECEIIKFDDGYGRNFKIDRERSSKDGNNIFSNMHFPLIGYSKLEEARLLKEYDCEDILMKTWFCHDPIHGMPCGHCNPCRDALTEGFKWRVPIKGRILGGIRYYFLKFPLRVFHYLNRKLKRSNK